MLIGNRYQTEKEIGRGGMATVYLARDPAFKRQVAVKIMHEGANLPRFRREAETWASLEHANVVPVYDYGEEAGRAYLVMRYMTGGSLAQRLKQIRVPEIPMILRRVAEALDDAHAQGVVHRDVKPSNILLDARRQSFLSDFGLVKLQTSDDTHLTDSGVIMGTPTYLSPEQARGESDVGNSADLYALGVVAFEMIMGHLPFDGLTGLDVVLQHMNAPVPQMPTDHPLAMWNPIFQRALAKQPGDRYASAVALAEAVDTILTQAKTAPLPQPAPRKVSTDPLPPAHRRVLRRIATTTMLAELDCTFCGANRLEYNSKSEAIVCQVCNTVNAVEGRLCLSCSRLNKPDAILCQHCGEMLTWSCPSCATAVWIGKRICPTCGLKPMHS